MGGRNGLEVERLFPKAYKVSTLAYTYKQRRLSNNQAAYLEHSNFLFYPDLLLRRRFGVAQAFCHALSLETLGHLEHAEDLRLVAR